MEISWRCFLALTNLLGIPDTWQNSGSEHFIQKIKPILSLFSKNVTLKDKILSSKLLLEHHRVLILYSASHVKQNYITLYRNSSFHSVETLSLADLSYHQGLSLRGNGLEHLGQTGLIHVLSYVSICKWY